jgi:hypothetical protein
MRTPSVLMTFGAVFRRPEVSDAMMTFGAIFHFPEGSLSGPV